MKASKFVQNNKKKYIILFIYISIFYFIKKEKWVFINYKYKY